MENFYSQQIEILDGATSALRSLVNNISDMKEKCYDLELSVASLHDPELIVKSCDAKTVVQETEGQFKALLDTTQELDSNSEMKLECHDTESDTSDLPENTNESCEDINEDQNSCNSGDQAQPHLVKLVDGS